MPDSAENWRTRALIGRQSLRHNLSLIRHHAGDAKIMAVVKSNAYGHGAAEVCAAIAERVDGFAVATMQEGIACRATNPELPVVVLSGLQSRECLDIAANARLQPVAFCDTHLQWLAQYRGPKLEIWLKIDTGMHRLGIHPDQVAAAIPLLQRNPRIAAIRLMSHFANADDPADPTTQTQLARFVACTENYGLERSVANSAALLGRADAQFDWVRPGIALYGSTPLLHQSGAALGLRPVMRLQARILARKDIARGQAVGYGGTFVAPLKMRLGIVGCGYGDGYPRTVRAAAVGIAEQRAPIVGRISMDLLAVDISNCPQVAVGDVVELWGDTVPVDEVAAWANTISYELLCKVSMRVARVVTD